MCNMRNYSSLIQNDINQSQCFAQIKHGQGHKKIFFINSSFTQTNNKTYMLSCFLTDGIPNSIYFWRNCWHVLSLIDKKCYFKESITGFLQSFPDQIQGL